MACAFKKNFLSLALLGLVGLIQHAVAAADESYSTYSIGYNLTSEEKGCKNKEYRIWDDIFKLVGLEAGFDGALDESKRTEKNPRRKVDDDSGAGAERFLEEEANLLLPHEVALLDMMILLDDNNKLVVPEEEDTGESRLLAPCSSCSNDDCYVLWHQSGYYNQLESCCPCCQIHCNRRRLHGKLKDASAMQARAQFFCGQAGDELACIDCSTITAQWI